VNTEDGGAGSSDAEARAMLARFARQQTHADWRQEVARLLDAPRLAGAGAAESARHSLGSDVVSDARSACFANPVYVQIGRYGGRLHRESFLALPLAETKVLIERFDADPPTADVTLHALPDGALLALIPSVSATRTAPPEDAFDQSIDAILPEGAGAASLRRLSTEIEIWLHALPLNRERMARGSPPITTLWLWGCGARPEHVLPQMPPQLASPSKRELQISSGDAYLRGMAQLLGATLLDDGETVDALLASGVRCAVADVTGAPGAHVAGADEAGTAARAGDAGAARFHAAVAAVRAGRIKRLTVVGAHSTRTLQRRDFLKLWRRAPRRPS